MRKKKYYLPKEISWLSFNERVLQESENPDVPLIERLKFMGIYSNNLDEYFRVRIATLRRLATIGVKANQIIGYGPKDVLKKIHEIVLLQTLKFEKNYAGLINELASNKIYIVNEQQLNREQEEFVKKYFHEEVRTRLMPFLIEKEYDFPNLLDDSIYLAISLANKQTGKKRFALLEVPTNILPRFIILPDKGDDKFIIFLDDVIRSGLKDIFSIFDFDEIEAYTIKVTKDAELEMADDISESYIAKLSKSLQQRKKGSPVRFIYDRNIPGDLLRIISRKLQFTKDDVIIPGNRYHNFMDFMKFPRIGEKEFYYNPFEHIPHSDLEQGRSILAAILKKDILLSFPYHSFDYFIELLQEASLDPDVTAIQITLYRLARNSSVINALMNAIRNGKSVTTVVELQARFDEEANILWGNKLLEMGVKVIYGIPGLKVHSKLCLITRIKNGKILRYAAIGTGNFNESTARIYTDHLLLSAEKKITNEVQKAFSFFSVNYQKTNYYHLILSPFSLRSKILRLIKNEIKNAKAGKKAYIYFKLNNLTDSEIIEQLYRASRAGVRIRLIIRGMLSLIPGVKNISENIKAISIVDRFLEHSRYMIFCNGGDELVFISSADLMPRNLDFRIEVTCPVFDKNIRNEIRDIFDIQWSDNVKARLFNEDQSNQFRRDEKRSCRSQSEVYNYLNRQNTKTE
jgi:polyphosphate kinase